MIRRTIDHFDGLKEKLEALLGRMEFLAFESQVEAWECYDDERLVSVNFATESPYMGSDAIYRANYKVLFETTPRDACTEVDCRTFAFRAEAILAIPEDPDERDEDDDSLMEALEMVVGLADYPLIDESLHCELEMEDQIEQWESWGKFDMLRDYRKAFVEAAPEELEDLIDYGELDPWFEKDHETKRDKDGEFYPEGSGDNVSFPNRFTYHWSKEKEVTEEELESALEWYICHVKEPRAVVVDLGSQWRVASSGLDGPPQVLPTTYGEGETRLEALVNATRYFFPKD